MTLSVLVLCQRCPRTTLAERREEGGGRALEPSAAVNHSRVNCCSQSVLLHWNARDTLGATSKAAMVTTPKLELQVLISLLVDSSKQSL